MNKVKLQGFSKFIAFLLIAVLVISVIVFAVNGNEPTDNENNVILNDSEQTDDIESTDDQESAPSKDTENEEESTTEDTPSKVINVMTGIPYEEGATTAFGIVIDPKKPSYGLSYADIAIEFPTENVDSRMLFYFSKAETVWKIGSISESRGYIEDVSLLLGGVLISNGNDDKLSYPTLDVGLKCVDISKHADCYYAENERYIFTNSNSLKSILDRTAYAENENGYKNPPFIISELGSDSTIEGANSIYIPYSTDNSTTLVYNNKTGKYQYIKCDEIKYDLLTGDMITYTNAFVLYANSTTYENSNASQLIVNTTAGGRGYYFSKGKYCEINWSVDNENLVFTTLSGELLAVNPGNSYITYFKTSKSDSVLIN